MTGIRFMDAIGMPRRSTIYPSLLSQESPSLSDADPSLAEYVIATSIDLPSYELFAHVCDDLEEWIARSKRVCTDADADALKDTPELFVEFVSADQEGQAMLVQELRKIKKHKLDCARQEWYEWKLQWTESLYEHADRGFADLEAVSFRLISASHLVHTIAIGCAPVGGHRC